MRFDATEIIAMYQIREHYGDEVELDKVIEELNELKVAVQQYIGSEKKHNGAIIDEMADVYIVLEHLKEIAKIDEERIQRRISDKVIRQLCRIIEERQENDKI